MVDLLRAKELAEAGELDDAWQLVDEALREDVDNPKALILTTFILEKTGKETIAYHLSKILTQRYPNEWAGWLNLGRCADHLWKMDEAEAAYTKALGLAKNDNDRATTHVNLSAIFVQIGRFADAIPHAELALAVKPDNRKARHNLGVSQLAARDWDNGWKNYSASIGSQYRPLFKYNDEPEWDGSASKNIVIYGEQGLGDEISAASMYADAIKKAGKVVIDCDHRLTGLYKRSFPTAKVYGTRTAKNLAWDEEDRQIDASISGMELGKLFRTKDDDFTGNPYLTVDPVRAGMWKAHFATKKKPIIGIAWSGGVRHTGAKYRQWSLEDLLPLFNCTDAHWVSLQYKDAQSEIDKLHVKHGYVDISQYPYATLTKDYDDTAALVSACDLVICMQTAVAHLCGAIGKECWVFLPRNSQWRYGSSGTTIPWYNSVSVIRQKRLGVWADVIHDTANRLASRYERKAA